MSVVNPSVVNPVDKFIITKVLADAILNYLASKPYIEVFQLIEAMRALEVLKSLEVLKQDVNSPQGGSSV
jgi:hypothetical protein